MNFTRKGSYTLPGNILCWRLRAEIRTRSDIIPIGQAGETCMKIDGGCHCGDIHFTVEVVPAQVLICHCTDCQTLSGSAYRTVVPALDQSFRLLQGRLTTYVKIAEDGTPREQTFCPRCGTAIFSGPVAGQQGMLGIRVGTTRQRAQLPPQRQYYCNSAQPWGQDISQLPKS